VVLLAPDGREALRLDGMKSAWVEVKPEPEETGGLWGITMMFSGGFQLRAVPPYAYADPEEFFIPEGLAVK
jgi:hypothetical protein